jgi:hypothetical protein
MLHVVGELSTLYVVLHLSLWMVIVGLVIALLGIHRTKAIAFPLGYLLTAIPLPVFFYASLSSQLQLWSSSLGVGCLQLAGVMAFREGNVIDLGHSISSSADISRAALLVPFQGQNVEASSSGSLSDSDLNRDQRLPDRHDWNFG